MADEVIWPKCYRDIIPTPHHYAYFAQFDSLDFDKFHEQESRNYFASTGS